MELTDSTIVSLVRRVNSIIDRDWKEDGDLAAVIREPGFEEFLVKANLGIAICSPTGYFFYVSKSLSNIVGYPVSWLYEKGPAFFQSVILPNDRPLLEQITKRSEQIIRDYQSHQSTFRISFDYRIVSGKGDERRIYQHTLPASVVHDRKFYTLFILTNLTGFKSSPMLNYTVAVLENQDTFQTLGTGSVQPESPYRLTKRENVIVEHLAQGKDMKEIASVLFISEATLKKHRQNILRKTGARNMVELVSNGIRNGWLAPVQNTPQKMRQV